MKGGFMENKLSNPAPLGLMGLGMTMVLYSFHNAGLIALSTMILAMGVFYGGLAQVIAGIMEFRKGNTFYTTAFTSFGLFWLSLVYLARYGDGGLVGATPTSGAMAAYLFMWGLFAFFMWLGTFGKTRALQLVLFTLFIMFWLLSLGQVTGNAALTKFGGWLGIFSGFSAIYLAMANVINESRGFIVLPVGERS
jgi:succinate-acetate transporter protein